MARGSEQTAYREAWQTWPHISIVFATNDNKSNYMYHFFVYWMYFFKDFLKPSYTRKHAKGQILGTDLHSQVRRLPMIHQGSFYLP